MSENSEQFVIDARRQWVLFSGDSVQIMEALCLRHINDELLRVDLESYAGRHQSDK